MRFDELIRSVKTKDVSSVEVEVFGIEYDSRRVQQGSVFVAMRGGTVDGNRFTEAARQQGAVGIITDSEATFQDLKGQCAVAHVESGRRALAEASAAFFHHPEAALTVSAVTGTNGKTTTAFLTEGLLRAAGQVCVLLGTIETHIAGEVRPSPHTTPESRDVLALFADGVKAGATEVVMEMSSHALEQERTWAIPVDVGVFTNLTQDHLDYHGTMDAYAAAKARLFQGVGARAPRVAIINSDDRYSKTMLAAAENCREVWTYSALSADADFCATDITLGIGKTSFTLQTPEGKEHITSQLTGIVNVYNLMAAIACALARGVALPVCARAAAQLPPVPGRFETVANTLGIAVIVDYAHTDDALKNLLLLARQIAGDCRILTVFGCGGDRDRTKRPKMGRAAGCESNFVAVTNDNPRTEDPTVIAEDVLRGVLETDVEYAVELDRYKAIEKVIRMAKQGDIVLIAGKGHEKEQILGEVTLPFDDVAVAHEILQKVAGER